MTMRQQAFRRVFSGIILFSGVSLAPSFALATCPPAPGPYDTVTVLPACCDSGLPIHGPCGVDTSRIELSAPLVTPLAAMTQDSGNPNKVHITKTGGSMIVTSYGACIGTIFGPGPLYNWTPFRVDTTMNTSSLSWTKNYPSSAWIGGDPDYVDLTKVTPSQGSVKATWSMGNNSAISLPDQTETFDLGCATPITKPAPKPPCNTCPPTVEPSPKPCEAGLPDPVDPYSGDYYYAEEDLSVPGIFPLKVVRAYTSSQSSFTGPFGVGTYVKGYNYTITVPLNGDGTVNTSANQQTQLDDGSSGGLTFSNNSELGTAGSPLVLTLDGSNHLASAVYTTPEKTKLHFDANGRLSSLEDSNGNTVAMTRDGSGRLATVSLLGRSLAFFYNSAVLIESVEDHTGRKVEYVYSTNNELLRVKNPSFNTTTYTWDAQHRVQTLVDYTDNVRFLNYYAANGMVKQQALKMGGSLPTAGIYLLDAPSTNVRVITDPNSNKRTYTYNSHGLITEFKDGLNHTDTTTYSANLFTSNPTSRYIETTDALSHTTQYAYDDENRLTTVTDPYSKTTQYVYNGNGQVTKITDKMGHQTLFTYDRKGRLTQVARPGSNTS